ncbi:hypothetical protein I302_100065 [Kwoniella bestiolae CBS 10118]|uniref:Uncharacterized protein n=1 Tax=Kwoniella bestiolae CBS 10118 TaxID=1296100 RepID=A0A1B9G406_9TREE|nr:hypothetical protein I302_03437 [Kwoniella bestiolae CBS 10118]OCF25764.1 hypothetical protein I302_03437 [Kwoniella bestiolae CBS 10118]
MTSIIRSNTTAKHDDHQTHNVLTHTSSLDKISAIHPHLLDILRALIPTDLLRVSNEFYDDLLPTLYRRIELNKDNVRGVLEGIINGSERKRDALGMVRELTVVHLEVLDYLVQLEGPVEGVRMNVGDHRLVSNHPDHPPNGNALDPHRPLFPKLDILHLPFQFISALDDLTISHNEISLPEDDITLSRLQLREDPLRKLSTYPSIFARSFIPSTIHLDLTQEIDSELYWSFDSSLFNLLDKIPHHPTSSTRLRIDTILPREKPERGYIPHNLLQPSSIHFKPNTSQQAGYGNGDIAKVIRDHYDVHISRASFPPIVYFVKDVSGVREELEKIVELRVRVEEALVLDEAEGGILREEVE